MYKYDERDKPIDRSGPLWCVIVVKEDILHGRYSTAYHHDGNGEPKLFTDWQDAATVCDVVVGNTWIKVAAYFRVPASGLPADPRDLLQKPVRVRIAS
jgi:hypothetical protein